MDENIFKPGDNVWHYKIRGAEMLVVKVEGNSIWCRSMKDPFQYQEFQSFELSWDPQVIDGRYEF